MRIAALILLALVMFGLLFGMFFTTSEHADKPKLTAAWATCLVFDFLLFSLAAGLFDPFLPAR